MQSHRTKSVRNPFHTAFALQNMTFHRSYRPTRHRSSTYAPIIHTRQYRFDILSSKLRDGVQRFKVLLQYSRATHYLHELKVGRISSWL